MGQSEPLASEGSRRAPVDGASCTSSRRLYSALKPLLPRSAANDSTEQPRRRYSSAVDESGADVEMGGTKRISSGAMSVSYTHLTLPTICSV
eukprot:6908511-Prymnesium_polylepis.1